MPTISAPPVVVGYAYAVQIEVQGEEPPFPSGCMLRAELRRPSYYRAAAIADLSTENGNLVRIDERTVELRLSEAMTAAIEGASVVVDLVRTDTDPATYQYILVVLPVIQPMTRAQ